MGAGTHAGRGRVKRREQRAFVSTRWAPRRELRWPALHRDGQVGAPQGHQLPARSEVRGWVGAALSNGYVRQSARWRGPDELKIEQCRLESGSGPARADKPEASAVSLRGSTKRCRLSTWCDRLPKRGSYEAAGTSNDFLIFALQ